MTQLGLLDWQPPRDSGPPDLPHAQGETYSAALDRLRLATVLGCVYRALQDGKRWTLFELARHCEIVLGRKVSETTVSAKLRDLRKTEIGGYDVRSERAGEGGTWVYWLEGGR
jgi:hypothetical protein